MPPKHEKKCADGSCNKPPPIKHNPKLIKEKPKSTLGKPPQIKTIN